MEPLAARLARGDEAAFAELYDACADRLHDYAAMRLGSREAASDVVQSAFLRAVKSRRRFRDVENPVAYMFQIARNEIARSAKRSRAVGQALPTQELVAPSDTEGRQDDADVVAAALARLSRRSRTRGTEGLCGTHVPGDRQHDKPAAGHGHVAIPAGAGIVAPLVNETTAIIETPRAQTLPLRSR